MADVVYKDELSYLSRVWKRSNKGTRVSKWIINLNPHQVMLTSLRNRFRSGEDRAKTILSYWITNIL